MTEADKDAVEHALAILDRLIAAAYPDAEAADLRTVREALARQAIEPECDHYKLVRGGNSGPWACEKCGAKDPPRPKYERQATEQVSDDALVDKIAAAMQKARDECDGDQISFAYAEAAMREVVAKLERGR